jgi:hypothetical protein
MATYLREVATVVKDRAHDRAWRLVRAGIMQGVRQRSQVRQHLLQNTSPQRTVLHIDHTCRPGRPGTRARRRAQAQQQRPGLRRRRSRALYPSRTRQPWPRNCRRAARRSGLPHPTVRCWSPVTTVLCTHGHVSTRIGTLAHMHAPSAVPRCRSTSRFAAPAVMRNRVNGAVSSNAMRLHNAQHSRRTATARQAPYTRWCTGLSHTGAAHSRWPDTPSRPGALRLAGIAGTEQSPLSTPARRRHAHMKDAHGHETPFSGSARWARRTSMENGTHGNRVALRYPLSVPSRGQLRRRRHEYGGCVP